MNETLDIKSLHGVLRRQLKKIGIRSRADGPPDEEQWERLLERVNRFYGGSDQERYTLERSLDISSREMHELHNQIAQERDRLHAVLGSIGSAIAHVDANWAVQFHNPAAEVLLGIGDASVGLHLFDVVSFGTIEGGHFDGPVLLEMLSKGTPVDEHDGVVTTVDGRSFPAHFHFNPMYRGAELAGIVVVVTDTTVQKRTEREIREARVETEVARRSERSRGMFLANMSHELRTPLNAIIGYSEMLAEDLQFDDTEVLSDINRILTAGRHLLGLINDILDLSKIDAGKMEISIETFDVRRMLDDVVGGTRPLVAKNGNRLHLEIDHAVGEMRSDENRLRQCLYNLMSNAAKFTNRGDIELRVAVQDERWLAFSVSDSGIGVKPERLEHLFDAFTQADSTTTKRFGGTGLGLTLVKAFCEMMGGTASVESTVGSGSSFTLFLPRDAGKREARVEDEHTWMAGSGTEVVLVVDDDPSVFDLVARWLSREDLRVVGISTAEQAHAAAEEHHPFVILLDVLLPGIDGWTLLKEFKADPVISSIPVVIVTTIDGAQRTARDLQAAAYLNKPMRRDTLLHLVRGFRPPALEASSV